MCGVCVYVYICESCLSPIHPTASQSNNPLIGANSNGREREEEEEAKICHMELMLELEL